MTNTKRRYVVQTGGLSHTHVTTSAGRAFRHMLRAFHATLQNYGFLVRYRVLRENGRWTRWVYQDPLALRKEP